MCNNQPLSVPCINLEPQSTSPNEYQSAIINIEWNKVHSSIHSSGLVFIGLQHDDSQIRRISIRTWGTLIKKKKEHSRPSASPSKSPRCKIMREGHRQTLLFFLHSFGIHRSTRKAFTDFWRPRESSNCNLKHRPHCRPTDRPATTSTTMTFTVYC